MLHFLFGAALCIFIGERVWHYGAIIRMRREERRYLASLYQPPPRIEPPPPIWLAVSLVVMMVALATLLATHA